MRRFLSFFALLGTVALLSSGCIISDYNGAVIDGAGDNLSHGVADCDTFDRIGNTQQLSEAVALGDFPDGAVHGGGADTTLQYLGGSGDPLVLANYMGPVDRAHAKATLRWRGTGVYESAETATIGVGSNVASAQPTPIGDPNNSGSTDGVLLNGTLLPYEPGVTTFSCNSRYGFGRSAPAGAQIGHVMGADGDRRLGVPVYQAIDTRAGCQFQSNLIAAVPNHWLGGSGHNGWVMVCYSGAAFGQGSLMEAPITRTLDVTPVFGEPTEVSLGDLNGTVIANLDEDSGDITVDVLELTIRDHTFVPSRNLSLTFTGGKAAFPIDPNDPALHELARWALDNFTAEDWAPFTFSNELIPFANEVIDNVSIHMPRSTVEHWVNFWASGTEPTQRDRIR